MENLSMNFDDNIYIAHSNLLTEKIVSTKTTA